MDQDVLVVEQIDGGRKLIDELPAHGFAVTAAAWANLADDGRYYLYVVSPFRGENGSNASYGVVDQALIAIQSRGGDPVDGIDFLSVKVVDPTHHLARMIAQVLRSRTDGGGPGVRDTRFPVRRTGDHTAYGMYIYGVHPSASPAPQPA